MELEHQELFTVQSYDQKPVIDGVYFVPLRRSPDDGGGFTELARISEGISVDAGEAFFLSDRGAAPAIRQINYSEIEPGVIRAFHVHLRQTDVWYVPPADRLLMVLYDARRDSPSTGRRMRFMLGAGQSRLVVIPPGVAHGARNLAVVAGRIIYFVDQYFSAKPGECDEGRYPWDFLGAEIWETGRG